MTLKSGMKPPSVDTVQLPSHFTIWLCNQETKFLRGPFVWANWDVNQLKARKGYVGNSLLFTANAMSSPFA
jgi:hypothetical protein